MFKPFFRVSCISLYFLDVCISFNVFDRVVRLSILSSNIFTYSLELVVSSKGSSKFMLVIDFHKLFNLIKSLDLTHVITIIKIKSKISIIVEIKNLFL